jgi:hypothetical protein
MIEYQELRKMTLSSFVFWVLMTDSCCHFKNYLATMHYYFEKIMFLICQPQYIKIAIDVINKFFETCDLVLKLLPIRTQRWKWIANQIDNLGDKY